MQIQGGSPRRENGGGDGSTRNDAVTGVFLVSPIEDERKITSCLQLRSSKPVRIEKRRLLQSVCVQRRIEPPILQWSDCCRLYSYTCSALAELCPD